MSGRASSRPSSDSDGFTLIELLVAAAIGTLVMGVVVNTLLSTTRYRREVETRLETQQGVKAAIDVLTRDIRLAGACLPTMGQFIALAGEDLGTRDAITVRIGLLDAAGGCIRTSLRNASPNGSTLLDVDGATGFAPGMRVWVTRANGTGEFARLRAVNDLSEPPPSDTLQLEDPLAATYPAVSGVYAVQERAYSLWTNPLTPNRSILRLSVDQAPPQPMALGIQNLDIRYNLRRNCPPCSVVPLPANDTDWWVVNDVAIDVTGSLPSPLVPGTAYAVSESIRVKPRNLLPPAA